MQLCYLSQQHANGKVLKNFQNSKKNRPSLRDGVRVLPKNIPCNPLVLGIVSIRFSFSQGKDVPVPSFEGFFGGASDVLYYHPEVTREVGKCVKVKGCQIEWGIPVYLVRKGYELLCIFIGMYIELYNKYIIQTSSSMI